MEYHLIQQYKGLTRTDDMNDVTLFGLASVELTNVGGTLETVEKPYTPPLPPAATIQEIKPVTSFTRNGVTLKMYDSRLIPSDIYTTGTVYGYLLPRAQSHYSAKRLQVIAYDYIRATTDLDVVKDVVASSGINPDAPTLVPDIIRLWKLSSSAAPTFARNIGELTELLTTVHSIHGDSMAIVGGRSSYLEKLTLSGLASTPSAVYQANKLEWMRADDNPLKMQVHSREGYRQKPSSVTYTKRSGYAGGEITINGNSQGMSLEKSKKVFDLVGLPKPRASASRDDTIKAWIEKPLSTDEVLRINRLSVAFNASWYEMYNTVTAADKFHIYLMTSAAVPSGLFVKR